MPVTSELRIMSCVGLVQVSDVILVACRAAEDAGIHSVCVINFRRVIPLFAAF